MAEYNPSKIIKDGNTYNFRDTTKIPLAGSNEISGSLIPNTDGTVNLGSPSYQWNNAYIKSLTINGVACGDILTYNASEFIPRSGGAVLDGAIFSRNDTDKQIIFRAGPNYVDGASLQLNGKNLTTGGGRANLIAHDGTNTAGLVIMPKGIFMLNNGCYLRPSSDNSCMLGASTYRWAGVYSNAYYLGDTAFGDIVTHNASEFVDVSTAQTIAGNKTFSGRGTFSADCIAYNPDSSGTTSGVKLRNSKAEVLSTVNTASDQSITFRDKNDFAFGIVKGAVQSNCVAVKIGVNAKDSSNNTITTELQIIAFTNGNKAIFPTTTGTYELGMSTYKWKDVNTVLLNGKTPAYNDDVIPRSGGPVITGDLLAALTTDSIGFGYGWGNGGTIYTYSPMHRTAEWQGTIRLEPLKTTSNFKTMQLAPDGTWTWSGTACQITSDQRFKQQITEIDDKLLDAWEDVELSQFKYNDAVEQKGKDKARLHTGFVVQQIDSACKKHGVDISNYGLYCHEVYPEETKEVEIEQADGTKTKETKVIREASEHYSLRYTEALIVECKYLRRCVKRLTARIEELEKGNNSK